MMLMIADPEQLGRVIHNIRKFCEIYEASGATLLLVSGLEMWETLFR